MNAIALTPRTDNERAVRISRIFESTAPGSTSSGSSPLSPSRIARSVPCPLPVSASDPYSSVRMRVVLFSRFRVSSETANSRAARIGPTV